jgi:hypothetical protein
MKEYRVHAELTGMVSKSGDREYDRQLSLGRVLRVKQYLLSKGLTEAQIPGPDVHAVGKDQSTSESNEDPIDRAVRIRVALGIKPRPLWPTIVIPMLITADGPKTVDPPPKPPNSDGESQTERWTIRQIFGMNMNAGVGIGVGPVGAGVALGPVQYHFLLVNRRTAQMVQCTFGGPGVSGGVGPSVPFGKEGDLAKGKDIMKPGLGLSVGVSITGQSKEWNNFDTKAGVDFSDFDRVAFWREPPGLGLGTDISLKGVLSLPKLGVSVDVTTGKTFGLAGASQSVGILTCGKPVQLHLP